MPSSPPVAETPLGRLAVALLGLAFAAFFGALGVSIVLAPVRGELAWAGWFVRGFIALTFGAMAGGGLHFAVEAILGAREPSLPQAVRERCPGCGAPWGAARACPACGVRRAGIWEELPSAGVGPGALLFAAALGGGMACLGLFLASTAIFGEALSVFMLVGSLALALLLLAVGGAFIFGGALAARDAWRDRGVRELRLRHAAGGVVVAAAAHATRAGLTMEGSTQRWIPIAEAPEGPGADVPPIARELARVVAVLHAREEVTLSLVASTDWSWVPGRAPDALERRASSDACVEEATLGEEGEDAPRGDGEVADAVRDRVMLALATRSLTQAAAAAASQPELAAAIEAYAAHLSAEEPDPRVLAALSRVLRGAPASAAPYRARG